MSVVRAIPAKKLINDPLDVVNEFIEGLVETYPGLNYLEGFPQVKVVFRADIPCGKGTYDKVAVISGGGGGHEPAHAGFVGEGMLTAAICGDVFSSPPVDSILAGIRAVTGPKGCLLIVKNYTGDRLNFGLAAEEAKTEGFDVETIFVEDDCALPPPRGIAGRRGLAGTVLVQKVAGAAAAAGLSLADVAAEAKHASEVVGTMGVALHPCTLPGMGLADRLGPEKMEYGLGIHGEPGAAVTNIQPVDDVVSHVLKKILSKETNYVPIPPGSRVVLMINGLGATPLMELMIAAGKAVPKLLVEHGMAVERVYTGSFMTSLDMQGFSISIMRADPSILLRLDAETKAPYWPVAVEGTRRPTKLPVPIPPSRSAKSSEPQKLPLKLNAQGKLQKASMEAGDYTIINLKDKQNEWDTAVGDGDCGSTMFRGAKQILEDIEIYPLNDAAETFNEIGSSIGRSMGGTSGIIHTILCKAACVQLQASSHSVVMPKKWAEALAAAIDAVKKYGKAEAGYRTLLDALIPALSTLEKELDSGGDPCTAFIISYVAALDGAQSTKHMIAKHGEPGAAVTDIQPVDEVVSHVLKKILSKDNYSCIPGTGKQKRSGPAKYLNKQCARGEPSQPTKRVVRIRESRTQSKKAKQNSPTNQSPSKKAILIGVVYPNEKEDDRILSHALTEVRLKEFLATYYKFKEGNIQILCDMGGHRVPNQRNIKMDVRKLVMEAIPRDLLYIHIAAHAKNGKGEKKKNTLPLIECSDLKPVTETFWREIIENLKDGVRLYITLNTCMAASLFKAVLEQYKGGGDVVYSVYGEDETGYNGLFFRKVLLSDQFNFRRLRKMSVGDVCKIWQEAMKNHEDWRYIYTSIGLLLLLYEYLHKTAPISCIIEVLPTTSPE